VNVIGTTLNMDITVGATSASLMHLDVKHVIPPIADVYIWHQVAFAHLCVHFIQIIVANVVHWALDASVL
jgi:hypothetical protein